MQNFISKLPDTSIDPTYHYRRTFPAAPRFPGDLSVADWGVGGGVILLPAIPNIAYVNDSPVELIIKDGTVAWTLGTVDTVQFTWGDPFAGPGQYGSGFTGGSFDTLPTPQVCTFAPFLPGISLDLFAKDLRISSLVSGDPFLTPMTGGDSDVTVDFYFKIFSLS